MRSLTSPSSRSARTALAALLLVALLAGCGGDTDRDRGFVGYSVTPAPEVGDLSLPDASTGGEPMVLRADGDGLLLVYFGYTHCPDICPMTLSDLSLVLSEIEEPGRVDVAMVTVDPDRDTDDVLSGYVESFVPDGHALRTTDDATLRAVADRFGASYSVTPGADGAIDVAHTASVYAVDASGIVQLAWTFGTVADDIRDDIDALLGGAMP